MRERTRLAPIRQAEKALDLSLQTAVKMALASDLELRLLLDKIQVRVENRVVFLEGEVETEEQKARAEKLARSVEKVRDVVNRLKVTGGSEVRDFIRDLGLE